MIARKVEEFLHLEYASGLPLLMAAMLAMVVKNSPADVLYDALPGTPVVIRIGEFEIAKPLLLWVNDGLMAVFFFMIDFEVKREFLVGSLLSGVAGYCILRFVRGNQGMHTAGGE